MSNFSNYGKTSVDVFAPGMNILSSVSDDIYSPYFYDAEKRNATTEYYGVFNDSTKVKDDTITPSTGDDSGNIKQFGSLKFTKSRWLIEDNDCEAPDDAELELSVENDRLKITVKNARYGEDYYIYFPYEKNPLTTGDDNTAFSIMTESIPSADGSEADLFAGEIIEIDDPYMFSKNCVFAGPTRDYYKGVRYNVNNADEEIISSAEETRGVETGIGVIMINTWSEGESHDASFEESYLATFDLNGADHRWHFSRMPDFPAGLRNNDGTVMMIQGIYNGRIICIGGTEDAEATAGSLLMYIYDPAAKEWTKGPDLPCAIDSYDIREVNGKLYVMFGFDADKSLTEEERILSCVWCFDGKKWELKRDDIKFVGRINRGGSGLYHSDAITAVGNGLIFFDASVDGGGNLFLYNTDTDDIEPLYYTVFDSISDSLDQNNSCVATRDGIYTLYRFKASHENNEGWKLCLLPAASGVYEDPYAEYILGDANLDGEVDITDVTTIQRSDANLITLSHTARKLADVDKEGEVNIIDATWLQRYCVNMKAPEGIGDPI